MAQIFWKLRTCEVKELAHEMDKKDIAARMALHQVKWLFNPHFGGVHEALVKSTKRAIYIILNDADVMNEKLATAFTGTKALLISRPLTYQSSNIRDKVPLALTLNPFLYSH